MPSRPKPLIVRHAAKREQRGTARERGYTTQWDKARNGFLAKHPLCVECLKHGRTTAFTVDRNGRAWPNEVDHIVPHKGDQELFWEPENWQTLCKRCHSSKTARGL